MEERWTETGPILLIMAAGMGSRYGGLKQMDPLGPDGEAILDYSIYDARRAGFRRVIFLIKHEIEADFRRLVGDRLSRQIEVRYAFQQLDRIPAPYTVPQGRVKPWGTGHAVLCCRDLIDAPFVAINADDYYGPHAFQTAYDALTAMPAEGAPQEYLMVGYRLANTVTENGYVARGVCEVSPEGLLAGIHERTHIVNSCDGPLYTEDGNTYTRLERDTLVSMNFWGFTPGLLRRLETDFPAFLETAARENPLKAEYFLPTVVDGMLRSGEARVRVLPSEDRWQGVTYPEDKPVVQAALRAMAADGLYPSPLWR